MNQKMKTFAAHINIVLKRIKVDFQEDMPK